MVGCAFSDLDIRASTALCPSGTARLATTWSLHLFPFCCYALDGGVLGKAGNVFYYAPDSLEWEDTECGYSQFLQWSLSGDLEQYYLNARWPEWQDEVAQLKGDQGLSIYPFLCAEGPLTAERSRKAVPILELYGLYVEELPKQLLADTQD